MMLMFFITYKTLKIMPPLLFFIDNEVDEIEPPTQNRVSNIATSKRRQSPRKAVKEKRNFVTLKTLKKYQQVQKESMMRENLLAEEDRESNGQDIETLRATNIEKNNAKFAALGLSHLACSLTSKSVNKSGDKEKDVMERDENDPEFIPTDEAINEAEDEEIPNITTKTTKGGRKRKNVMKNTLPKRITRSHANQSLPKSNEAIELSKEVNVETDNLRDTFQRPNLVKPLQQQNNQGIGSMEKYLEMRKSKSVPHEQSEGMMDHSQTEHAVQLSQTEVVTDSQQPPHEENCQPKRRFRGQTRLDSIHTRKLEDRKIIKLNERKQPIGDKETVKEFSNFLGTLGRQYVRLDHLNWMYVPLVEKEELWDYVKQKYIVPEEGKPWALHTIGEAYKGYKCRLKTNHFKAYDNDNDRRNSRPDSISAKQFETLLKFWNDEKVQQIAAHNTENRKKVKDQHTCGPISFARVAADMQNAKPDKAQPTKAELFVETRKRKPGRTYTSGDSSTREKLARIGELSSADSEQVEAIIGGDISHGRDYLLGRMGHIKKTKERAESSTTQSTKFDIPEEVLEEITSKVREEVRDEFRAELDSLHEFRSFVTERLKIMVSLDVEADHEASKASIGNRSAHSDVGEE